MTATAKAPSLPEAMIKAGNWDVIPWYTALFPPAGAQ